MKFLTALISVMLFMGCNVGLAQSIDRTELFSELNAIRTDRSCNATNAQKLFYFRKGPKTRTSYQVEKDVLSGIQEVFPDLAFFDVSGLGLLAKLDQGSSDQYVDMIKASLKAVNEPGLYIHADFSNLDGSDMLEIQAWTIDRQSGSLEQACSRRSILFADQNSESDTATQNKGIIIQGDVSNSGTGTINIIQSVLSSEFDHSNIDTLESALLLLSVSNNLTAVTPLIPLSYAYQLNDATILQIGGSSRNNDPNSNNAIVYQIDFRDGKLFYATKQGTITAKLWSLSYIEGESTYTSITRYNGGPTMQIPELSLELGKSSYADIALQKGAKISTGCHAITELENAGDVAYVACYAGRPQFASYVFGRSSLFESINAETLTRFMHSDEIPLSLLTLSGSIECLDSVPFRHDGDGKTDAEVVQEWRNFRSQVTMRYGWLHPDCVSEPHRSWITNEEYSSGTDQTNMPVLSQAHLSIDAENIGRFLKLSYISQERTPSHFRSLYPADKSVEYYGEDKAVSQIVSDKMAYFAKWKSTRYWNIHDLEISTIAAGSVEAKFRMNFKVTDKCRQISGISQSRLVLERDGATITIISESGKVLSKNVERFC